jgi:hypothetical protein
MDGLYRIKLIQLAGIASSWAHREDHFVLQKLGEELLHRLQVLAKPQATMPVIRYREEQIVKMLGKRVLFQDSTKNLNRTGILEGLRMRGRVLGYTFRLRGEGEDVWQMKASEESVGEGTVALDLGGDEPIVV